jgi:DNA-binding transcriptional ArsR family regulator
MESVSSVPQMAEVAALVGDPARANILCALLGGRALTATELAFMAGVSPQTASGHLGKLHTARLLVLMKQGRHRYYRLAGPHVGHMLESIMNRLTERGFVVLGDEAGAVTPAGAEFLSQLGVDLSGARAKRRIFCRPCVDWTERRAHIGGAVGAALASRLFELKWIDRVRDSRALSITPAGCRSLMEIFTLSV